MSQTIQKILEFVDKVASRKSKYKQVILVREDLKLPKGKMAAQVAHASVGGQKKRTRRTSLMPGKKKA